MTAETTCPSAPCAPGATLLGLKGPDGRIHNMRTELTIDADFVEQARAEGSPEARMRFASKCQTSGCTQWDGAKCGVVEKVLAHLGPQAEAPLQPCIIRHSCRWFRQRGAQACHACAYVITDQEALAAE